MAITSTFIRNLRSILVTALDTISHNSTHYAVIKTIDDLFLRVNGDLNEFRLELCLSTASGIYLDEWGSYFGIYRKYQESDNAYRVRIILEITRPKVTKPSMEDWIREYLNERSNADYTKEEIYITEPWKELSRYSHFGELSATARMYSKRYWTHAVIEIHIPAEEKIDNNLRSLINKIKAAGVQYYFARKFVASGIVDASQWGLNNLFEKHTQISTELKASLSKGQQISGNADLSGSLSYEKIYTNNYTFFDVTPTGDLMPKDTDEELKPYSESELEEIISEGEISPIPREKTINDNDSQGSEFHIDKNGDIELIGYGEDVDYTHNGETLLDEDGDVTPIPLETAFSVANERYFTTINFGDLTTTDDKEYVNDEKYQEIEVLTNSLIVPADTVNESDESGFVLLDDGNIEVSDYDDTITADEEKLFEETPLKNLTPTEIDSHDIDIYRYFTLDETTNLTLPEELDYFLKPTKKPLTYLSGQQMIWFKKITEINGYVNYYGNIHNIFSSQLFTMEEIDMIYNAIFNGESSSDYHFFDVSELGEYMPKAIPLDLPEGNWEMTQTDNEISPASDDVEVDDDLTLETKLDNRGDLTPAEIQYATNFISLIRENELSRLQMNIRRVQWSTPPFVIRPFEVMLRDYVVWMNVATQPIFFEKIQEINQMAYNDYAVAQDKQVTQNNGVYVSRLHYLLNNKGLPFTNTVGNNIAVKDELTEVDDDLTTGFDVIYEIETTDTAEDVSNEEMFEIDNDEVIPTNIDNPLPNYLELDENDDLQPIRGYKYSSNTVFKSALDDNPNVLEPNKVFNPQYYFDTGNDIFDLELRKADEDISDETIFDIDDNGDLQPTDKNKPVPTYFELDDNNDLQPIGDFNYVKNGAFEAIFFEDYELLEPKLTLYITDSGREITNEDLDIIFEDNNVAGVFVADDGTLTPIYYPQNLIEKNLTIEYMAKQKLDPIYIFDRTDIAFSAIENMTIAEFENNFDYYDDDLAMRVL